MVPQRRLRDTFRVPVDFLCHPGVISTTRIERAARDAGYLAVAGLL